MLFGRISRLVEQRNMAMLSGVTLEERALLHRLIDTLFRGGMMLLEQERSLAPRADSPSQRDPSSVWRPSQMPRTSEADLIVPDLYMLLRLLRRSADLAYSRVTGLLNFDWRALSTIKVRAPITLSELIAELDRNKSQVGRAVERLSAQGLVERRRIEGVPSIVLSVTAEGDSAFMLFFDEACRRHDLLADEITAEEHRALDRILDKLTENALGLLAAEREADAAPAGRAFTCEADDA
jgi:DNA-binding MarR family transcriptional regulator